MTLLTLRVLGPLQVAIAGTPISALESDKARALLAYLAVEADRPHRREALIGLFWPDCSEQAARHNLRQALFNVRQAIGDHTASPPYLLITRDEIQFNRASVTALDLAQFNTLFNTCDRHLTRCLEDCPLRAARLEEVVELYRGKFLEQFFLADSAEFEEWALVQREAIHQRALDALVYLASYYERHTDYEAARRHTARQLELDPWREEAHRQMMRVLAQAGQPSAALKQYETCRSVLAEELGVEPSIETRELHRQISQGEFSARKPVVTPAPPPTVHNLPAQLTPFIGRERELVELGRLVADPDCRFVTLVGPGGIGKTRLALQTAAHQRNTFAHGAVFVQLAAIRSPDSIVPALADALGFSFNGPGDPKAQLLNYLREKQMLLVLDNVEQLLEGAGLFVEILQHAPEVKLLLTSRESLDLQGEWLFEVEGLNVPEGGQTEGFEEYSAVALFLQRARRARAGFVLDAHDRAAVARLCRMVEGMPLALELAATWVRTLSPADIAAEIERSLDFLSASARDLPERHRSMRAVFDYSWQMLSAEEQRVLCKLSVFRGGFLREAAEQVAGASLSLLSALVTRSLVRRTLAGRYDVHELVRQYAHERLAASTELEAVRDAHMHFFLKLAEAAEPELRGAGQLAWLDRLENDHDNLRVALEWSSRNQALDAQASVRLTGALHLFWKRRAHWSEGRDWLNRALAQSAGSQVTRERVKALNAAVLLAADQADTRPAWQLAQENLALSRELGDAGSIARSLNSLGFLLWKKKDFAGARASCEEALGLGREMGDRFAVADSLHNLSHIAINQGDYTAAQVYCGEAATIYRELGDDIGLDDALGDLGLVAYLRNDHAAARPYLEESLARFRRAASVPGIVSALNRLGDLARCQGDYARAERLYAECLALYRDMGDKDEFPSLLHNLAYAVQHRGDDVQAIDLLQEGLAIHHEMGNQAGIAECLAGIATVLTAQGQVQRGAQLLGAAEALREASGATWWPADRIEFECSLALLRQSLGQAPFAAAWAEGRRLLSGGIEAAVVCALQV